MGLRTRLKNKILKTINRFTGEYSAGTEQIHQREEYETQATADESIHTQRARLKKPVD